MEIIRKCRWLFLVIIFAVSMCNPLTGVIFAMLAGGFCFILSIWELNIWVRVSDYKTPRYISGTGKWADNKRKIYAAQVKIIPQTVKGLGIMMRIITIVAAGIQIIMGGLVAFVTILDDRVNSMGVIKLPREQWGMVGIPLYILVIILSVLVVVAFWQQSIRYIKQVTPAN